MTPAINRKTREKRSLFFCALYGFIFLFTSCSSKLGYSVVLWDIPEYGLGDGDIVSVYFKSNVTDTYAVGLPPDEKEKVEVPAWRLTAPSSRGNAVKTAERFAEYKNQYAVVAFDGLPIRGEPSNTARQVYRLKKNEVIKVLYREYNETGNPVMIGNAPAEGDWLRVMTDDGTQGWCFSFNLRLFNSRNDKSREEQTAELESGIDPVLESILSRVWYPEIYESLILNNTIDLTQINRDYGFSVNTENQTVKIRLPEFEKDGAYTEILKQADGSYVFADSSVYVIQRLPSLIVVTVTDERGMPTANNFIAIDEPVDNIISTEKSRRSRLLRAIISLGPVFSSANYGTLQFAENNSFYWQDFYLLSPSIIPSGASDSGTVEFKYFLSRDLSSNFDGVITFNFENSDYEVNFFYMLEGGGLRLEDAAGAVLRDNVFQSRGNSPIVAFFARQ